MRRYAENYSRIAIDDIEEDMMSPELKRAQARKAIDYVGGIRGNWVLDIGVGKGILLHEFQPGNQVGIDIAEEYLCHCKGNLDADLAAATAECLPFKPQTFGAVFATDILEHVIDVADVLKEARRVLRPGGKLVVRVPDREDIRKYGDLKYDFAHLRSFDRKRLCYILRRAGFVVTRVEYDGFVVYRPSAVTRVARVILKPLRLFSIRPTSHSRCAIAFLIGRYRTAEMKAAICQLPNWLGNLLCRPVEIAVVCRRAS